MAGKRKTVYNSNLTNDAEWKEVYKGKTIGYKHICCLKAAKSSEIKIVFKKFKSLFKCRS